MKLSTRARYALRMMLEIARSSHDGTRVSMTHVARTTGISKSYLEQLAIPLKGAGLLQGHTGRTGGYCLGRPAKQIVVREVVEAAIGALALVECVADATLCARSPGCETRFIWTVLTSRLRAALEEFTLADLTTPGQMEALADGMRLPEFAGGFGVRCQIAEPKPTRRPSRTRSEDHESA